MLRVNKKIIDSNKNQAVKDAVANGKIPEIGDVVRVNTNMFTREPGDTKKKFALKNILVSKTAKEKIESAGGSIE